jgi:D-alanyl-D-alanine carboxypeptidase
MTRPYDFHRLFGPQSRFAVLGLHTMLGIAVLATPACGELETSEVTSAATVASFITSTCSTASVLGLSKQIADEIGCMNPNSLVRFTAGSGVTFTSNAVLPYLEANARRDLLAVGNVQVNSGFRTVAQQFLIVEWFNRGLCGITAAAAPGRSNHESGRAVDLQNWSARVTAMANHAWAHNVPGDPVHFEHLSSPDIRGRDTLAFQRLWNRNHPGDRIAEDGLYGPQTESRIRQSPATGFATGPACTAAIRANAEIVAIDGPDRVAPGTRAHYRIAIENTTAVEWPATTRLVVADGAPSELHDATTWASPTDVGEIGTPVAAGAQTFVDLDIVAPTDVTEPTAVTTDFALVDGVTQVGTVNLAVTVTPDGDDQLSGDSDDQYDGDVSGGCSAGGPAASWLALVPALLFLRRRRRS